MTLLGGAAHPMTPDLGQGAAQAAEDAVALARCLQESGPTADACGATSACAPRGLRWVVRRSRRLGRVGQLENPLLCLLRDRALAMIPSEAQLRQLEEVMGHEP